VRLFSRLAFVVALAALGSAMIGPGSALANNDPHRVFLAAGSVDLPKGFCAFPTHYDVVVNKEYGTITTLADGTVSVKESGKLKIRATNVDSGKSILLVASGPGTVLLPPDGSLSVNGQGHWLISNPEAIAATFGLPGVMLTSGNLTERIDRHGNITDLSVTGRATDVCALLS
jgi:hypothetical protein